MKTIYNARPGRRISPDKAQIYGECLYDLKEEAGDLLSPAFVVKKSRNKKSPLHDFFTWDDTKAAELYRIREARYLIGSITVVIEYDKEEEGEEIKAFHNIKVMHEDGEKQGYVTIAEVRKNQDFLDIVIANAYSEMIAWGDRYKQYRRLAKFKKPFNPIFKSIDNLKKDKAMAGVG